MFTFRRDGIVSAPPLVLAGYYVLAAGCVHFLVFAWPEYLVPGSSAGIAPDESTMSRNLVSLCGCAADNEPLVGKHNSS